MTTVVWILLGLVALAVLDRALLSAEERGFIYYRRRKASPGTLGNAALHVQALLEPQKRHVLEQRLDEHEETDEDGEPPEPGRSR